MATDLDLAAMRAAAELVQQYETSEPPAPAAAWCLAYNDFRATWPPATALALLERLKRAEAVCEALRNGIDKALMEIDDAGPKALKYARQELDEALNSADKLEPRT